MPEKAAGAAAGIVVNRDELVQAVKIINVVPESLGVPSSRFVRITPNSKSLELALASALVAHVNVPVDSGSALPVFIDRRAFIQFVNIGKTNRGDFTISFKQGKCRMVQGGRVGEFVLQSEPVQGYGVQVQIGKNLTKLSEDTKKMLAASSVCAAQDPILSNLLCVYLYEGRVLASNQILLFMGDVGKADGVSIPFPPAIVPIISEEFVKGVFVNETGVVLGCTNGTVFGIVSADARKKFPKTAIIEHLAKAKKLPLVFSVPVEKLYSVMNNLAAFLGGVPREEKVVRLEISDGKCRASVRGTQGVFSEAFQVDGGQECKIEWPIDLVSDVFSSMAKSGEDAEVRFNEKEKSHYLVSAGNIDLMISREIDPEQPAEG